MNNSNSILLIDPAFDPATSTACNLLVKVGVNSFSYAIINHNIHKVIAVYDEQECENIDLKIAERLKTDPYLTLSYKEVKIALPTLNVIAIPNVFYDEYSLQSHAKLFPNAHGDINTQVQQHFNYTSLFSVDQSINAIFTPYFPNAKKVQENTGLVTIAEKLTEATLILDFSVGSFNALYICNQQIVFQQCYEIEQAEEFNYYLLFIIHQLAIDPKITSLLLSGIIDEKDEKYKCILKYFNTIQFSLADRDLAQEILEDMPLHYYSNLLALNKCVL